MEEGFGTWKNKSALIDFLEEWSKDTYVKTIAHRELLSMMIATN